MPDMPEMHRTEPGPDAEIGEIEADLAQTRQELGETAQALAAKLDVPAQARAKVDETKQRVAETTEPLRENALPITAAALSTLLVYALVRRRIVQARPKRHHYCPPPSDCPPSRGAVSRVGLDVSRGGGHLRHRSAAARAPTAVIP